MKKIEYCLVCSEEKLEKLTHLYSRALRSFFHGVGICTNCGHIQLQPMVDPNSIERINDNFFSEIHHSGSDINSHKLEQLSIRLSPFIKEEMNVLDVGSGNGWSMGYFNKYNCNYFAIEKVNKSRELIIKKGGDVIAKEIEQIPKKYESFFDIILFRHVIEHLTMPLAALKFLKHSLKKSGFIYLALPNAKIISNNLGFEKINEKGFRTSFLRPVHLSYFHPQNVEYISSLAGLKPIDIDLNNEIFMLLSKSNNKKKITL